MVVNIEEKRGIERPKIKRWMDVIESDMETVRVFLNEVSWSHEVEVKERVKVKERWLTSYSEKKVRIERRANIEGWEIVVLWPTVTNLEYLSWINFLTFIIIIKIYYSQ